MHHQPRRLQLGRVVGNAKRQRLEVRKARAELLALAHVFDGAVEAELRAADRAGRDVEPPAVEPGHRDLESLPLGADQLATGTRQFSKMSAAVGCDFQPSFFSCAP